MHCNLKMTGFRKISNQTKVVGNKIFLHKLFLAIKFENIGHEINNSFHLKFPHYYKIDHNRCTCGEMNRY